MIRVYENNGSGKLFSRQSMSRSPSPGCRAPSSSAILVRTNVAAPQLGTKAAAYGRFIHRLPLSNPDERPLPNAVEKRQQVRPRDVDAAARLRTAQRGLIA